MFDEYDILEYLLNKAFSRVRIPYGTIYEYFGVGLDDNDDEVAYEDKRSVNNFLNSLEKAEKRIVKEVMNQDVKPIYSVIFYKKRDRLPGIGYYDVFRNRNQDMYIDVAGDLIVQDAFRNQEIKDEIFQIGLQILRDDLDNRFPDQESIDSFIQEVKIYRDI